VPLVDVKVPDLSRNSPIYTSPVTVTSPEDLSISRIGSQAVAEPPLMLCAPVEDIRMTVVPPSLRADAAPTTILPFTSMVPLFK
jgi:hypothetical protein